MLQTCCFILMYPCCAYVCDIQAGNKYLPKSRHNCGIYLGSEGLCTIDTRAGALNASYYQTPLFTYFNAFPGFCFKFFSKYDRFYLPIPTGIIAFCVLDLHSMFANGQLGTKCWSRWPCWSEPRKLMILTGPAFLE